MSKKFIIKKKFEKTPILKFKIISREENNRIEEFLKLAFISAILIGLIIILIIKNTNTTNFAMATFPKSQAIL
ncbi:hypothetical protein OZZ08_06325 [Malaciobacter mytili]|uniref:hypothetical protein n=1 Tax=Malaciobacter mytili TaxID=603050 RepID=UPI00100AFB38|nr:hypothetical protein [Malaciobacter mytili]